MKLSIKNQIHDCDKHLDERYYYEEVGIVETIQYCTICGRIKNHDAYGHNFVIEYKPKVFTDDFEKNFKRMKNKR